MRHDAGTAAPESPIAPDATSASPLFSLGDSKQELIVSYRSLETDKA